MPRWNKLINQILNNEDIKYDKPIDNYFNDNKFLKIIIRKIRFGIGATSFPSYNNLKDKFKKLFLH